MKISVILRPCPWCKRTPEMWLPTEDGQNTDDTWMWYIECYNPECDMQPKSPHVSIRKTTKKSVTAIALKLDELACKWNNNNDCEAYEKKVIDLEDLGL
jgi:hypothetical protein